MNTFKQKLFAKKLKEELSIKNGIVKIDQASCDACKTCLDLCPYDAINISILTEQEVKQLSFKGRLKVRIKGNEKAVIDQGLCTACGLCMKNCHEFAIHKTSNAS